jgi:hypothetical protein
MVGSVTALLALGVLAGLVVYVLTAAVLWSAA